MTVAKKGGKVFAAVNAMVDDGAVFYINGRLRA
jgi:hypothetical protein